MSLIFMDGFDDGLRAFKWTTPPNIDYPGAGRTGNPGNATGTVSPRIALSATEKHATIILGTAFRVTALSDRTPFAFRGDTGTTTHISINRTSTGAFEAVRSPATVLATTGPNVHLANTWYFVELKIVLSDTIGQVIMKVNGVTVINVTGADTKNGGTDPTIDDIIMTTGGGDMLLDDFYLLNGAGSVNNNFIGDCSVLTKYPNGNGNYSQGVGSDADSVDNYLLVDETGTPNTSDYVAFSTTGDKDSYAVENLAAGTIYGIAQRSYAAKSDAGARLMRNFQRISGTDYPSVVDQGLSITPTYQAKSDIVEVNPATSALWTVTEFNAAEFGVEAR